MLESTRLSDHVNPVAFMTDALRATTTADIDRLLEQLPLTSEHDYSYDGENPEQGWQHGKFHWVPVGRERGNAGRIKQANHPVNPIAERTINGMEALIELERQRELLREPTTPPPPNPREAVLRYFTLPALDRLPKLDDSEASRQLRKQVRELARRLRVGLIFTKTREFTVSIEDDGIGQPPGLIHRTLLSLGSTTKADKWYLIGVFGQGGSSAYAVSKYSWLVSRRAPDLLGTELDGAGWTVIKHVFPRNRRDDYYAYLASSPDGRVPSVDAAAADTCRIAHGTRFVHLDYDFGRGGSAITRQLYVALNHVLYNPLLPFDTNVAGTVATVYGNGYRLSSLAQASPAKRSVLDKSFADQPLGHGVRQ